MRQKNSQKIVISPTILSIKFFHNRKFLKRTRFYLRIFLVIWDRKLLTENRDTPTYTYRLLLAEFFWNTEGFVDNFFRQCETKNFDRKSWYPAYPQHFSKLEIFWHTEIVPPSENIRHWEIKKKRLDIVIPPSFLSIKIFPTGMFPKDRSVPLRN